MNRRAFFGTMVGGVVAGAAVRTFPFRVYSFATDIIIVSPLEFPEWMYSPAGYLYDPNSKQELAKFMGLVGSSKTGLNVSPVIFHTKEIAPADPFLFDPRFGISPRSA